MHGRFEHRSPEVTLLSSLGLSLSLGSIQLLVVGSPCCLVACRGKDQPALRATSHTNDNYFQHLLEYGCTHLDQQPVASSETRRDRDKEETETRKRQESQLIRPGGWQWLYVQVTSNRYSNTTGTIIFQNSSKMETEAIITLLVGGKEFYIT